MKRIAGAPRRRFRAFRPGEDKESDRWCAAYHDYVEVFSHKKDGKGGIVPNPEFETADFELTYRIE